MNLQTVRAVPTVSPQLPRPRQQDQRSGRRSTAVRQTLRLLTNLDANFVSESIGFDGNAEETGRRASHGCLPADVMGIVEVAAAALRTRAATSGTRCIPLVSEPCEASEEPIFFDGAHIVYIAGANGATSTVVAAGYVANIAEIYREGDREGD